MTVYYLTNRRKTREYLLMFFYSKEIEGFEFDQIKSQINDYFGSISNLIEEEDYEFIQEHISDIFNSVKITKLESDDKVSFNIPGANKELTMDFGEMDKENIKDGFFSYSYKLADSLKINNSKKVVQSRKDDENKSNLSFFKSYFKKYETNIIEIDKAIEQKLENWDFARVSIIDKLIIRMGVVEFMYFPEIPDKVIINEAIELGKKFSSEKSNVFINGILNKLKDELREQNKTS
ncbi:MAG: transcription antitermination factor NusB [Candidatus Delongbacteria bacterium]|nr:transcription antitermination factor NusB [Candidatus Delongbacteria bacterium]